MRATFVLTNVSQAVYLINPAGTPLEGLRSDCLRVKHDGRLVEYDGMMVKRAKVPLEAYHRLAPDESLSSEIVINDGYELVHEGRYEIAVDTHLFQYVKEADTLVAGAAKFKTADAPHSTLSSTPSRLEVVPGTQVPYATEGERARGTSKLKAGVATGLLIASGDEDPERDEKEKQARKAWDDAFPMLDAALGKIDDAAHYKRWFGERTDARAKTVKSNFTKIRDKMNESSFTLHLSGPLCTANTYAYTYKGSREIWLCNQFWKAPATGINSKAGTIVHEASHAIARTDDIEYGEEDCRQLAIDEPDSAIKNADNYEYFAEHA